jgi:hypothetical protein
LPPSTWSFTIPVMRVRRLRSRLLVLFFALALPACKDDLLDSECNLVVLNESRCNLSIYVDGQEAFAVRASSDRTLDEVGPGRHVLEALDPQGRLVQRRVIQLATGEDFYWTLDRC